MKVLLVLMFMLSYSCCRAYLRPSWLKSGKFTILSQTFARKSRRTPWVEGSSSDIEFEESPDQPFESENSVRIHSTVKKFPIDLNRVRKEVDLLQKILKIEDFGLDIMFVSEVKMRSLNREWRSINKSTDVLSFPIHEFTAPEQFIFPRKDISGTVLGEIVFAPGYIMNRITEDLDYFTKNKAYDNEEDRGVSKLMATKFTLEERIPLLMIHSLLHLLGYDHETNSDWTVMTKKEDEVIKLYYQQQVKI